MDGMSIISVSFSPRTIKKSNPQIKFGFGEILFIGLLSYMCIYSVVGTSCNVLPLSVSTITNCQDGVCSAKQTGNWVLPINSGSSVCINAPPLGEGDTTLHFNLTILASYVKYSVDYCYFTDDYIWDIKGLCGCYGGTTASCSSCPAVPLYNTTQYCLGGYHDGTGCLLHATATYCLKVGFAGLNRFKVCKTKSKGVTSVILEYFDGENVLPFIYTDANIEYTGTENINVTIYDAKDLETYKPEFYLIDSFYPTNFYLLPDSVVNDINSYNTDKIGWMKTNKTSPQSILQDASVNIVNCATNQFALSTNWFNIEDYLIDHGNKLSSNVAPGSFVQDGLLDVTYFDSSNQPDHLFPDEIMMEGSMFLRSTNSPSILLVGKTVTGTYVPNILTQGSTQTVMTAYDGGVLNGAVICTVSFDLYVYPNGTKFFAQICGLSSDTSRWGMAVWDTTNGFVPGSNPPAWPVDVTHPEFNALDWVTGDLVRFKFGKGGFKKIATISHNHVMGGEHLLIPITNGRLQGTVEFSQYTIEFQETSVKPQIDKVGQNGDSVIAKVRSVSGAGTCVMTFEPSDVIPPLTIELTLLYNEYESPISKSSYHGEVDCVVTCYKYNARKSFDIDLDRKDDNDGKKDGKKNNNNDDKDNNNKDTWYENVGEWFREAGRDIKDFFSFKTVRIIFIVLLVILLILFVGWLAKAIYFFVLRRRQMRRRYGNKDIIKIN